MEELRSWNELALSALPEPQLWDFLLLLFETEGAGIPSSLLLPLKELFPGLQELFPGLQALLQTHRHALLPRLKPLCVN